MIEEIKKTFEKIPKGYRVIVTYFDIEMHLLEKEGTYQFMEFSGNFGYSSPYLNEMLNMLIMKDYKEE